MRWLLLLALLLATGSAAAGNPKPEPAALVAELQRGGHVIVMRHGATHPNQADLDPWQPEGPGAQRQLNDRGRADAAAFGAALKAIGVRVRKTWTSRFNRAYETALLAGFANAEKTTDLTEGGLVVSPQENARRAKALRAMIEAQPDPGTTLLVVTHKPNILDALGRDWFEVREGEASIFRPESSGVTLVARVRIEEWPALAAVAEGR